MRERIVRRVLYLPYKNLIEMKPNFCSKMRNYLELSLTEYKNRFIRVLFSALFLKFTLSDL